MTGLPTKRMSAIVACSLVATLVAAMPVTDDPVVTNSRGAGFPSPESARPSPSIELLPGPSPAALQLQQAIAAAIASNASTVRVAGGEYHFNNADLELLGATGLLVESPAPVKMWFAPGFGVHLRDCAGVHLGNWSIDYDPPWAKRTGGLTYQLTNSSDVVTEDLTILSAPQMAITAFLGGGGHVFRRIRFEPRWSQGGVVASQDAMHFSDLRRGPLVEDSVVGFSGDDFFNVHSTIMMVLECPSPTSCVIINPHIRGASSTRPCYGGYTAMATARPGDHLSLFHWPADDVVIRDLGGTAVTAEITSITAVTDPALLSAAGKVSQVVRNASVGAWTGWSNSSYSFNAGGQLWKVELAAPLPPRAFAALQPERGGVIGPALATVDEIGSAGAVLRNNNFTHTACNLGRFKSAGGAVVGNIFSHASLKNLELTELLQWYEGPIRLGGIVVEGNTFVRVGGDPVHCGPLCEMRSANGSECMAQAGTAAACPACRSATPWATATVRNNTIIS